MIPTAMLLSILAILSGLLGLIVLFIELHRSYRSKSRQAQRQIPWPSPHPSVELPRHLPQPDCSSVSVPRLAHIPPSRQDARDIILVHRPKYPLPLSTNYPTDRQPSGEANKHTSVGAAVGNVTEWVIFNKLSRRLFGREQKTSGDLEQGQRTETGWAGTRQNVAHNEGRGDDGSEARVRRGSCESGRSGFSDWTLADVGAEWDRYVLEELEGSKSGRGGTESVYHGGSGELRGPGKEF